MVVLEKNGSRHTYWLEGRLVWKRYEDFDGVSFLDFDRQKTPDAATDYIWTLINSHLRVGWRVVESNGLE